MTRRYCKRCHKTHEPPTGKKCPLREQFEEMESEMATQNQSALTEKFNLQLTSMREEMKDLREQVAVVNARSHKQRSDTHNAGAAVSEQNRRENGESSRLVDNSCDINIGPVKSRVVADSGARPKQRHVFVDDTFDSDDEGHGELDEYNGDVVHNRAVSFKNVNHNSRKNNSRVSHQLRARSTSGADRDGNHNAGNHASGFSASGERDDYEIDSDMGCDEYDAMDNAHRGKRGNSFHGKKDVDHSELYQHEHNVSTMDHGRVAYDTDGFGMPSNLLRNSQASDYLL